MPADAIQIRGLREFVRSLRQVNADLPKELRVALNVGAGLVVDWAKPRVPVGKTGRTQRSVRATSTQSKAAVTGGGARVPWYPFIDFGGRVGRKRVVHRTFVPDGRYIYPGYAAEQDKVQDEVVGALVRVAHRAGFDVQGA